MDPGVILNCATEVVAEVPQGCLVYISHTTAVTTPLS